MNEDKLNDYPEWGAAWTSSGWKSVPPYWMDPIFRNIRLDKEFREKLYEKSRDAAKEMEERLLYGPRNRLDWTLTDYPDLIKEKPMKKYKVHANVAHGNTYFYETPTELSVIVEAESGHAARLEAWLETFRKIQGFKYDWLSYSEVKPTQEEMDEAIGRAAHDGFYQGRFLDTPWGDKTDQAKEHWIEAGKAARKVTFD